MYAKHVLFNVATFVSLGAFCSTVYDGFSNLASKAPETDLTTFIGISSFASLLRVPLLLTDEGSTRELFLFCGFIVLETLAFSANLLAYAEAWVYVVVPMFATISLTCAALLSVKLARRVAETLGVEVQFSL